jgi:hypothetical protein
MDGNDKADYTTKQISDPDPSVFRNGPGGKAPVEPTKAENSKYAPIEEQLVSDDIQQVYASRLYFQQKIK